MKPQVDAGAANKAVAFIERLKHTKGRWAGQPFKLERWQRDEIIAPLFGTLNRDGTRRYRTAFIELPRKNGKTTLAAAIALYLLFADREMGAEVYSAANDRTQASLVFDEAARMVRQEPLLLKRCRVLDSNKRIVYYRTNSFYRAISAEAYSKHGFDAHGVVYDELHAAPDRDLWDVLTTSTGSRSQPLVVAITTAGYDRNSICWEQHDYALKVLKGVVKDPTFLPVIYAAPEEADWLDERIWRQCNPALGRFRSLHEMRTLARKAQATPALEMTFRRLYLNQWTSSAERWMALDKWDATAGKIAVDELRGRTCYAGLDLSATTDLTALALVFPSEAGYEALLHFWIPKDTMRAKEKRDRVPYSVWARKGFVTATEGNVIDYKAVRRKLEEWAELYDIQEVAFDRWGATKLSQELIDAGFNMVPFGQGFASMSAPTKELMNLVLGKKLKHGGNPVLRWNIDNLVVKQDPAGNLKPDKSRSTNKIDGAVALIMAIDRASRHGEDEESPYESRGLVSV